MSLHRYGCVYPGTGGASSENCLNYPFAYAVGDLKYLKTLGTALREVEKFDPDLVAVSAGFDAHRSDPVCSLGLSEEAYSAIGRMIADLNRETFAVLEGGYGRDFPKCILNFLKGLEKK